MESKIPNITSIESQNTMIQDIHPRVEEQVNPQVNPQKEQVNPQEEQVNPQVEQLNPQEQEQ